MGCGTLLTLHQFSRFHVIHIHISVEPTPRVASGVPFPLTFLRTNTAACMPTSNNRSTDPYGRCYHGLECFTIAIMSPRGYNDYVAALGAVEGYSLTARRSAGTYHAASVDQVK